MDIQSKSTICIPVCSKSFAQIRLDAEAAAEHADMLEFRLDCLEQDQVATLRNELVDLVVSLSRPIIVTYRARDEGGYSQISRSDRIEFWRWVADAFADHTSANVLFDIELDLVNDPKLLEIWRRIGWKRIICSFHDFGEGMRDLSPVYDKLLRTEAGVLKIAVNVSEACDCVPFFDLLARAKTDSRELIPIAMGEAGVTTRILGPAYGAFLTFGSANDLSSTAPGQLTAATLRELYRISNISPETRVCGLIGSPVGHSLSPKIHNASFAASGLDAVYIPFEVHNLDRFVARVVKRGAGSKLWPLMGFSVTTPHKLGIIKYLDSIDSVAQSIGAVNTVVVSGSKLLGYNTDVHGFITPLRSRIGSLSGMRAAIIGTGGAARSALWALQTEGADVTIFARDPEKGKELASTFGAVLAPSGETESFRPFDVVVNATPLGTRGILENEAPATLDQLKGVKWAYDMVYNPYNTQFLLRASKAGCNLIPGVEMLIAQAEEQFRAWTGLEPPTHLMRQAAFKDLEILEASI
jgi:3-dehydroquinate dehydratase/shikimate dehydrogenase